MNAKDEKYDLKYKMFIDMYEKGVTPLEIAKSISVNIHTIYKWRSYGTRRPQLTNNPSEAQKEKAHKLLLEGMTYFKAAKLSGVSRGLLSDLFPGMGATDKNNQPLSDRRYRDRDYGLDEYV